MKSLIIYTSITKNTEQVAHTFGAVFEAFGIETTYAKVLPKYKGGEIQMCIRDSSIPTALVHLRNAKKGLGHF